MGLETVAQLIAFIIAMYFMYVSFN